MRYFVVAMAFAIAVLSSASASQRAATPQALGGAGPAGVSAPASGTNAGARALVDQYCVTCHNQRSKTANLALDTMDLAEVAQHGEVWEKVVRKLRGGLMPPPGSRRPDGAAVNSFVSFLETKLDQAAAAAPNPGSVTLHRLNRAEYAKSMR